MGGRLAQPDEEYLPVDIFLERPLDLATLAYTVKEMPEERRDQHEHPL